MSDTLPKHAALNRRIQTHIGQQLYGIYNDLVAEGIPRRFIELLDRLDEPAREEGSNEL